MHWRWNVAVSLCTSMFVSIGAFLMPRQLGCAIWYPGATAASIVFPIQSPCVLPAPWEFAVSLFTNVLLWSAVVGAAFWWGDRLVTGPAKR